MSDPWTYVPFQLGWQSVTFGGFRWYNADLAQPPNFGVPAGTTVQFFVGIIGVGLQGSFTGDLTEGSTSITSCTDITDICPGQMVLNPYLPFGEPTPGPYGDDACSRIATVGASTITFGNGPWNGQFTYADPQGALATMSGQEFLTVEDAPLGDLAVQVSGGGGVTITDTWPDGTGEVADSPGSNGLTMCNLCHQANAQFSVLFADAGTFVLDVEYTASSGSGFASGSPIAPTDPYAGAITVTVSS